MDAGGRRGVAVPLRRRGIPLRTRRAFPAPALGNSLTACKAVAGIGPGQPLVAAEPESGALHQSHAAAARSGNNESSPSRDAAQTPRSVIRPVTRRAGV